MVGVECGLNNMSYIPSVLEALITGTQLEMIT
jgi:hypothetical protein